MSVHALAQPGYRFLKWDGDGNDTSGNAVSGNTSPNIVLAMNEDKSATAPVQPVIDTQVIISASTISIKTPCPQIRVTYEREGYLPVERQYSANSPNQAVADDVVMKSLLRK